MFGKKNHTILVLSDCHFPYNHPDCVEFLRACKEKYKPDRVVSVGDEVDLHSLSFHNHSPDLLSPNDELITAINRLKPIYEMFPQMDVCESNHGSLVYRRAEANGLPAHVLKSYREILEAPKGWKWHKDITIKMSNGMNVYICHSIGGDVLRVSQSMGMSVVQGHHHEKFEIRYWANSLGLYWGMFVGCMIEDDSLAFRYNKTNLKRPLIGCGVIVNGIPQLIPMILSPGGRWSKVLP
jgi:hypothetical protein